MAFFKKHRRKGASNNYPTDSGSGAPVNDQNSMGESTSRKKRSPQTAKSYALYLVSKREYSIKLLREKLIQKEFPESEINEVLSTFEEYGFISDTRYATLKSNNLKNRKGDRAIAQTLKQKGIDSDTAKPILEELDPEIERLMKAVPLKFRKMTNAMQPKIINYYLRQGFSYSAIKKCMGQLKEIGLISVEGENPDDDAIEEFPD